MGHPLHPVLQYIHVPCEYLLTVYNSLPWPTASVTWPIVNPNSLPSFFSYYPLRPGLFLSASQTGRSHSCLCTCTSLLPGASAWHTQTSHQSGLSLHISLSERPPWEAREVKRLPFSVSLSFYFAELSSCCYLSSSEITFSKIYLFTGLLIVFPH